MPVLQPPYSASTDNIENYLEMRLGKNDKLKWMCSNLLADMWIILEEMSNMCAGEFLSFSLYQWCIITKDCV